jgi:two-component system, NarL family, response regulator DesR
MSILNILLVDDNQNLVMTLSHGLCKAMGSAISVAVCRSGSEALSRLSTQSFDVVISEFNLPGESGLELFDKIRQNYHETLLILATTYGTEALEEEVHRLGIGYIVKPFGIPLLVQIIHDLLQGGQSAKPRDETGNVSRILISEPEKGNAGMP